MPLQTEKASGWNFLRLSGIFSEEPMTRLVWNTLAAICGFLLVFSPDWAQTQTHRPEFDVATVKVNKDGHGGSLVRTPGGLTATNAEFSRLIEMAFQTNSLDLSAVPESLRSERFDIVARASGKVVGDQHWDMLRLLLEQRFELKHHTQEKSTQLYALMPVRSGTSVGPKISRSPDSDCPVEPTGSNFCGVSVQPGHMIGQRVTMVRIARELSGFTDRPVQDQTGLSGRFDFQLTWTPEENVSTDGRVKLLNGTALDTSGPSFYPAVREQLGLKLQATRGQIDVLVIDHAEQPREN
jgi:uncharacterized protein (TIGR03435 family)